MPSVHLVALTWMSASGASMRVTAAPQKRLSAGSGLAPVVFGPRALTRLTKCRSFYFDLHLLQDYWLKRKYHHTMSSALVYALHEALTIVEEEGSTLGGRATSETIAPSLRGWAPEACRSCLRKRIGCGR
jgi:aspartate aminotransferase-like enzyme